MVFNGRSFFILEYRPGTALFILGRRLGSLGSQGTTPGRSPEKQLYQRSERDEALGLPEAVGEKETV